MNFSAYNFIKKEILAQAFSCQFCDVFKNTDDCFVTHDHVNLSVKFEISERTPACLHKALLKIVGNTARAYNGNKTSRTGKNDFPMILKSSFVNYFLKTFLLCGRFINDFSQFKIFAKVSLTLVLAFHLTFQTNVKITKSKRKVYVAFSIRYGIQMLRRLKNENSWPSSQKSKISLKRTWNRSLEISHMLSEHQTQC